MKCGFVNELNATPIRGDDLRWILNAPLIYSVDGVRGKRSITVPRNFVTDFASIPRIFWRVILPTGSHREAAVLHDWLYYCGDRHKAVADGIFLEAMESLGVPAWRRWSMFFAVLFGGWSAWYKHRRRELCEPMESSPSMNAP